MLRVAVVGCGDVSVVHLEAIAAIPGAELVGICGTDPVLLEKPLAHRVADGERIVAAAESSGTRIGVCFHNRCNAVSVALRELLDSGRLGPVAAASATVLRHRAEPYYRSRPWRAAWATSGGGTMINQAIHTLDLLQWLLGDVIAVSGRASRRVPIRDVQVEDTADLVLDHDSRVRSVLFATTANGVDAPVTLEITCEQATLFVRGDLTISWLDGRTEVVAEPRAAGGGRAYWGASHQRLIADFYDRLGDAGKTRAVFDEAFADFQRIGFTAVKADVPEDMTAAEYADWIAGYGLALSLSLFNSAFDETIDIAAEVERARRFAATQLELGLDRTMVSSVAVPARMERRGAAR